MIESVPKQLLDSPRTGEPTRPWTIWVAFIGFFIVIADLFAATLWTYWIAVYDYSKAAWIFGAISVIDTTGDEPVLDNLTRVLLVVGLTLSVVLISAAAGIAGYYGLQGYKWARIVGLITLGLSLLSLLINPIAWGAIGCCLVGSVLQWLPPSNSFFYTWKLRRYPVPVFTPTIEQINYGPLPKYQATRTD